LLKQYAQHLIITGISQTNLQDKSKLRYVNWVRSVF